MTCPHCKSAATTERPDRTELGYRRFRCRTCKRGWHERTGTPFNHLQYPTDIVCLVVLWRFRYKLSLRDLAEMFLQRGISFTHEAVREWESKLAPLLSETLRKRRHGSWGKAGMWTKRTSKSKASGATSTERSIETATSWMFASVIPGVSQRPRPSFGRRGR